MRRKSSSDGRWLRAALLGLGLAAIPWFILQAQLPPTPSTGEGPFFPVADGRDSDFDLTHIEGHLGKPQGQPLEVRGTVRTTDGQPVVGARILIWQTDIHGKYDHPREQRSTETGNPIPLDPAFQYWGQTVTDDHGRYLFRTIVPGSYGRRPAHIHFKVTHPGHPPLASEMQFLGDPGAQRDFVTDAEARSRLAVELVPGHGDEPASARFDIVLGP